MAEEIRAARLQLASFAERNLCGFPVPVIIILDSRQRKIAWRRVRVEFNCSPGIFSCFLRAFVEIDQAEPGHPALHCRPQCQRWSVARIELDCLIGVCKRLGESFLAVALSQEISALQVRLIS